MQSSVPERAEDLRLEGTNLGLRGYFLRVYRRGGGCLFWTWFREREQLYGAEYQA